MTISLTLFIGAGIALVAIICFKAFQERMDVLLFWPDSRNVCEKFLQKKHESLRLFAMRFGRKNFYIVTHFILLRTRRVVVWIQAKLDKKLHRLIRLIRGRREIEMRGPASRFLHDITRFRDGTRKDQ